MRSARGSGDSDSFHIAGYNRQFIEKPSEPDQDEGHDQHKADHGNLAVSNQFPEIDLQISQVGPDAREGVERIHHRGGSLEKLLGKLPVRLVETLRVPQFTHTPHQDHCKNSEQNNL